MRFSRWQAAPFLERFLAKVAMGAPDECWPWLAFSNGHGYGRFQMGVGRGVEYAHRLAFQLATGEQLGANEEALHSCDNTGCCNPAHLFRGTQADNIADMVAKGRHKHGAGALSMMRRRYGGLR